MFFLEGAVIDECKTFEELEVKESSYCQFIDQWIYFWYFKFLLLTKLLINYL